MAGLLGRKIGMSQVFDPDGKVVCVTVIEAGPCIALELKPEAGTVKVAFEPVKAGKIKKPQSGYFAKRSLDPHRYVRELPFTDQEGLEEGGVLDVSLFDAGDYVDVVGTTKGRGFAGMIKRWNASRFPMTHGHPHHRVPGSQGSSATPARVMKGKKLPGHYGNKRMTVQNLKVVEVRPEENLILLRGAVPGPSGRLVVVKSARKKRAAVKEKG